MTRLLALFRSRALAAGLSPAELPPRLRPDAALGCLDVTKYFSDTSGGIKTYLLEKSRYVASRSRFRQVMVVPGAEDEVDTRNGSRIYRLKGPRIPTDPNYRFLLATRSLQRIIEHEQPDIIEIGSPLLVPWFASYANRRHQAPMVWYYHGHLPGLAAAPTARPTSARALAGKALARYVRLLGDRFPAVLCGSDYAMAELHDLGVDRVARVPLGVDLLTFHPGRRDWAAETREQLGLPDVRLALYIGRFGAEKRLDLILDAWPEVERRCRMRLVMIGVGPEEAALRRHPYGSRVIWLPHQLRRDRLADLMAAVDVVVAPGPLETLGLAVLEGLASGTPVLSVDTGGGAELVRRSRGGELYHDGDAEHAAEAAVWLSKQNLRAMGQRARAYAEANHAWDIVLDRLFRVYQTVRDGGKLAPIS